MTLHFLQLSSVFLLLLVYNIQQKKRGANLLNPSDIIPINKAVITIVYSEYYYHIIHQITNVKGKTQHEDYNRSLSSLMSEDLYFSIHFPYETEKLAKDDHLAIMIQNPGYQSSEIDYVIFFPENPDSFQLNFLDSQEQYFQSAREINFERYNKSDNSFYNLHSKRKNDYQKYKEYLEALKKENISRQRKIEL